MKRFSVTSAVAEPFRQAARRPLATLIWGLVLLAPTVVALAAIVPIVSSLAISGAFEHGPGGAEVTPSDPDFQAVMQFQIWTQLANIAQLFTVLLVTTAIIRAVFAGRRGDGPAFLRIGMQELYVAVIGVTVGVGMIILVVIGVLLAVALGLALSGMPEPWRILTYVGMGIVLTIGCLALWGRLALLVPASIRYDTFAFAEGWKLGRGQTRRLLGVMVLMFLIGIVICIAVILAAALVVALVGGGIAATDPDALLNWLETLPQRPAMLVGLGVVLLLPTAWVHGFCQLLATAPFARAVRDLAGEPGAPAAAISADTAVIAD